MNTSTIRTACALSLGAIIGVAADDTVAREITNIVGCGREGIFTPGAFIPGGASPTGFPTATGQLGVRKGTFPSFNTPGFFFATFTATSDTAGPAMLVLELDIQNAATYTSFDDGRVTTLGFSLGRREPGIPCQEIFESIGFGMQGFLPSTPSDGLHFLTSPAPSATPFAFDNPPAMDLPSQPERLDWRAQEPTSFGLQGTVVKVFQPGVVHQPNIAHFVIGVQLPFDAPGTSEFVLRVVAFPSPGAAAAMALFGTGMTLRRRRPVEA